MISMKRIFQICVLSVCALSPTTVFAEAAEAAGEVALFKSDVDIPGSQVTPETPSVEEGLDFGDLGVPEPMKRSCTATSQCTPVGGTPLTCTGSASCSTPTAMSVRCDGTTTYCSCNPSNIPPPCADPVGFCACYTAAPWNWANCRQTLCQGP